MLKERPMIQNCKHYDSCRLPTSVCNSKCKKRYQQVDKEYLHKDYSIKQLWILSFVCVIHVAISGNADLIICAIGATIPELKNNNLSYSVLEQVMTIVTNGE